MNNTMLREIRGAKINQKSSFKNQGAQNTRGRKLRQQIRYIYIYIYIYVYIYINNLQLRSIYLACNTGQWRSSLCCEFIRPLGLGISSVAETCEMCVCDDNTILVKQINIWQSTQNNKKQAFNLQLQVVKVKVKVKVTLEQATKDQRGVEIELYCLFNLGDRWGSQLHAPAPLPPGMRLGTHFL